MRKNRSLFSPGRIAALVVISILIGFAASQCDKADARCQLVTTPAGIRVCP